MGKGSAPAAPAAPNPVDTARASTSTNVATAITNAFLNNTNQNTPDGSLRYDQTDTYNWTDPYTGTNIAIPRFTATQTLSPQQQAIQDQSNAAKMNLAGMANTQSDRLATLLGKEIDLSGAPTAGDPNAITNVPQAATTFGDVGQQQSTFGAAGDITKSYGAGDFSADRQNVQDALMARMNPQLAIEKQGIEQQLADQGIRYGSQAYSDAMMNYSRQANDARFGAISQAGQEQQRMMDMAAQRAGFENAAQQQQYQEEQGRGTFANQAQAANFQQAGARADYLNAGLAQQVAQAQTGFNAQNMARNQFMNEQYAQRNQPINEISSLLSGSQINNPNFVNTPNNQIPTTDVAGLINNRFTPGHVDLPTAEPELPAAAGRHVRLDGWHLEGRHWAAVGRAREGKHHQAGQCSDTAQQRQRAADLQVQLQGRPGIGHACRPDGAGRREDRSERGDRTQGPQVHRRRQVGLRFRNGGVTWHSRTLAVSYLAATPD